MDVHQAIISVAVMDASGKLLMECLLETKASTIIEFIQGLQGTVSLTFEEGRPRLPGCTISEASCQPTGGLRSAKGRPVEGGE
jgi:hypothetical protein